MPPLVQIDNVSLFIPGDRQRKPVLQAVCLQIDAGRHLAITGPNGSGKSTLLRLIHGDLWPAAGSIFWLCDGRPDTSPIVAKKMVALVSPMHQENCQRNAWDVSLYDFLSGGIQGSPMSYAAASPESRNMVDAMLDRISAKSLALMRLPELSQGQLRIALLARAVLSRPRILLLDEWTDGLDECHKQAFYNLFEDMTSSTTMVFASHRRDGVPDWCQCFFEMRAGRLGKSLSESLPPPKISLPKPAKAGRKSGRDNPRTVFKLANVNVYVDRQLVLKDINWQMLSDENWLIDGPNGSGKSTFLRLLAGREFAAAGGNVARYDRAGRLLATKAEINDFAALISDLDQATYGYPVTGLELVCSGLDDSIGIYRQYTREEQTRARQAIESFFHGQDASEISATSIRRLSTGQLRKLFLARAFVRRPQIILLDEACSGLDPESRSAFLATIDDLANGCIQGWRPQIVQVTHYGDESPVCINRHARIEAGSLVPVQSKAFAD